MRHQGTQVAITTIALLTLIASGAGFAQEPIELPADAKMQMTVPSKEKASMAPSVEKMLADEEISEKAADKGSAEVTLSAVTYAPGRVTYSVQKWERGRTLYISPNTVAQYCGDGDGCELRLGMYNWDNTGRVASRQSLFYYNPGNRAWRAERGDSWGTDWNGTTQHVMHAWACYFTDGVYNNWHNLGDGSAGFGLLSWNQYNAGCILTIID